MWDSSQNDAYAIIGNFPIKEFSRFNAIVGDAVPPWMICLIPEANRIITAYSDATATAIQGKPMILITVDATPAGGQFRGDALTGFIRLNLWGKDWVSDTETNRVRFLQFLAHELFHLWNGYSSRPNKSEAAMLLLEGGADAAALEALETLKLIAPAERATREADSLNRCSLLDGKSILDKTQASASALYVCGLSLFTLVTRARTTTANSLSPPDTMEKYNFKQ